MSLRLILFVLPLLSEANFGQRSFATTNIDNPVGTYIDAAGDTVETFIDEAGNIIDQAGNIYDQVGNIIDEAGNIIESVTDIIQNSDNIIDMVVKAAETFIKMDPHIPEQFGWNWNLLFADNYVFNGDDAQF
jgi:phage-related protein